MIADTIRLILSNIPLILFVLALVIATLRRHPAAAERYLAWLLLLSVGLGGIWAGVFHIFFPEVAAASIGWQVSPFQFEIGVADMAIGITAVVAFWRGPDFRAAVVWYIALFNLGVAIGHLRQAIEAGDYAANNFGILLAITVIEMVLLPVLAILARRR
jgi:hypothetical protein